MNNIHIFSNGSIGLIRKHGWRIHARYFVVSERKEES